ncbi:hypothetical protein [Streptomyces sp. AcE210]|uniref:hypothetical protein n=1 Tax=Streptomyces sp. AcE210 TaxID=2292703 RepID=UPI0010584D6A|nr:hypothetical protein [Streptomyces sp. AcE210]
MAGASGYVLKATLMLHSHLAREYDHRPDTSASRVYWATIANMARRLTTPSPAWRDTLGLVAQTSSNS